MIDVLVEAMGLKALARTGWLRRRVPEPESVAAHSWGVSLLVCVLLPEDLDRARALTYAALHDLPEVRVGDIAPSDGVSPAEKAEREHAAMAELGAQLPSHLLAAFEAYESQGDDEARFVRQLDRLDMALQALAYARAGHVGMAEFVDSAEAFIEHPSLMAMVHEIRRCWPAED